MNIQLVPYSAIQVSLRQLEKSPISLIEIDNPTGIMVPDALEHSNF